MIKISLVINTLNEEKNLPGALVSVKGFADEVIVVDMKSTDLTRTIAKKAGCKVYEHKKMGYVEPARNFAISKAKGDWILILDADERLTPSLKSTLKKITKSPKADFYRIPRKNIIFGKWVKHSRWWPDHNIRFFKKGKVEWNEIIHSVPTTFGKGADLEELEENALVHYHYDTVEQFIERMNRYTSMQSKNLKDDGYKFVWQDIVKKPCNEFLSRYFQGEGYKDGLHGLALASLQAFSELVLYLKIWQLEKFQEKDIETAEIISEMKDIQKDINYWQAHTLLQAYGGIKNRIKRKFKLS